jgi:hypothetical protein
MRNLVARVFDYSLDGVIAAGDTTPTIASGSLGQEVDVLRHGGDGYIVVHGGIRSGIRSRASTCPPPCPQRT